MASLLENNIRSKLKENEILITSHIVMGYPSVPINLKCAEEFSSQGVDIIELQFPFSEPIADGPTLMVANQQAIENKMTIDNCFEFAHQITSQNPNTIFLIMTYYNIVFQRGEENFIRQAAESGILGVIIPDLPPEVSTKLCEACERYDVAPIFLVTPKTDLNRIKLVASMTRGMLYCNALLCSKNWCYGLSNKIF